MSHWSTDHLTSRSRFKSRKFDHIALLLVIFITSVSVLSWAGLVIIKSLSAVLVGDVIAIALVCYLHVVWHNQPIRLRCPACRKIILSNTPWVCTACGAKNLKTEDFPFVNRCGNEQCGVEPKAYRCHHSGCKQMIFLSDDEDKTNYAYCLNSAADANQEDVERLNFEREKRRKEYAVSLAKLTVDLDGIQRSPEATSRKTPHERVQESWEKRRAFTISAAEIYRQEKAANAERFKGDEEMIKWANEALDDWYKSGAWERSI